MLIAQGSTAEKETAEDEMIETLVSFVLWFMSLQEEQKMNSLKLLAKLHRVVLNI